MATLLIIRLHPVNPTAGGKFTSYLTNLKIEAFDLSFDSPKDGVKIGTASGAWSPPSSNPLDPKLHDFSPGSPRIFQHFSIVTVGLSKVVELESVATAVLEINLPPGHTEYDGNDIRLEITNNLRKVLDQRLDFNVATVTMSPLSNDPTDYITKAPAVFAGLPDPVLGLDPTVAFVDMPADGTPPLFDTVVNAVDLVLKKDPALGATIGTKSPLTAAQARQVAREIVWNRLLTPPPDPPRSLEEMYTRPPTQIGLDTDRADMDRKQFEASLTGFYATQDAQSERLTKYVFAASAATWAAAQSDAPARVGFTFPVEPGPVIPGTTINKAQVALVDAGGFTLNFHVPASYFYALTVGLAPSVSAEQRYRMATLEDEARIVTDLHQAIDDGVINADVVTPENGARRLVALGSGDASALVHTPLNASIDTLLTAPAGWLAFMGADVNVFWAPNPFPAGHLDLLLSAVTHEFGPLIAAIKAIPVTTVAALKARTTADWNTFFLPANTALLPPFTAPGTPQERVAAFIRQLRKFFDVQTQAGPLVPAAAEAIPFLDIAANDPIGAFVATYNAQPVPPFAFGSPIDASAFDAAVQQVFAGDVDAQKWLAETIRIIDELFQMTAGIAPAQQQFSLMEALYARGFTSKASVVALTPADFTQAMTGTIAYAVAGQIHVNAGNGGGPSVPPPGSFTPVNPDGLLVNCIPPWHLSPLGPVEYVHEMLLASASSTCDEPFPVSGKTPALSALVGARRGPLGSLLATAANVHTPIPLIDIVNESLEALVGGAVAGVVFDTNGGEVAGHKLRAAAPEAPKPHHPQPYQHEPAAMFAAVPEHSSPATPVAKPAAYDLLRSDFTAPVLPYAQQVDIVRSYLTKLGTSRFQIMRTFREEITEFAIHPALEPADFQRHLWRYPVRIDVAREYVHVSPEEYDLLYGHDIVTSPTAGRLLLRELYGFKADTVGGTPWTDIVVRVPEFVKRTGLTYCELIELWRSKFVDFKRQGNDPVFPDCEPCCEEDVVVEFVSPNDPVQALKELAVFIRLWRTLRTVRTARYSFADLRDICQVLHLFNGAVVNADFIRQLAAFQMLRDDLQLSLGAAHGTATATGADRLPLLALWVGASHANWGWAVGHLIGRIEDYAEAHYARRTGRHGDRHRSPEFMKLIAAHLDPLSDLAGFDSSSVDTWSVRPASTLRFAEVLTKIYLSDFTTGELLYLFTPNTHLDGDDPFPEQDTNEAFDSPLDVPEADHPFGLWALRRKLLAVEVSEEDERKWTWSRIVRSLEHDFGYVAPAAGDPLQSLGEHFFPDTLSHLGTHVSADERRYRVSLNPTKPGLWNSAPHGPFQYDNVAKELYIQLPLVDADVENKLGHLAQLTPLEQAAVRDLYFSPRADLAHFAFLFENFTAAEHRLIEEDEEHRRWAYFRRAFALFYARCEVVAQHLAGGVSHATDRRDVREQLAWEILRRLLADENRANPGPWEQDSGKPPSSTFWPLPNGGAFAALVGLTGTGLLGRIEALGAPVWEEVRGPMRAFGRARNERNMPFPTVLPAMDLSLPPAQQRYALLRNGLAIRDGDGERLGGAEGFSIVWRGILLIEQPGIYQFSAGAPTERGHQPDFEAAEGHRWRLNIHRGQKTWLLLNHRLSGEKAPSATAEPLYLRRGGYEIIIEFKQEQPSYDRSEDACAHPTGFEVKYRGPDSGEVVEVLPIARLYRDSKDGPLHVAGLPAGAAATFLAARYSSSLRDVRRTYQRAFKALLFAHRLGLSAKRYLRHSQSEIGFLLDHPERFAGTSYFPGTPGNPYVSHRAYLDFNFLAITDPYRQPLAAADDRVGPSLKRRQATFDWFERLFDYGVMSRDVRMRHDRIVWLQFLEAENQQPADPTSLLVHQGIDLTHAPLLLAYDQVKNVDWNDLVDERWTLRVWHGDRAVRRLLEEFVPKDITAAKPRLWASSDDASLAAGTANLTQFYRDGCVENGDPRRYEDVKRLNDSLRERARAALLAYLCSMDRVPLPWGVDLFAREPEDLSVLLLLDVRAGLCERASRIEEEVTALQLYVERARLGLEKDLVVTEPFVFAWDRLFATFRIWQTCRRRLIYRENWIEWIDLESARKTEAFRFLESELRRTTLTAAVPGGMEYWPGDRLPEHPSLTVLQHREPSYLKQFPQPENLGLMGTPDRHARPSWLAPSQLPETTTGGTEGDNPNRRAGMAGRNVTLQPSHVRRLPFWIQAAIRLGTRFLRIAAAGEPMATSQFIAHDLTGTPCCVDCGKVHPPVMDEYYFWLVDARYYDAQTQDADWGATKADPTPDWERPDKLPALLSWSSKPMVRLAWCRVHNGEFQPPRTSDEGAHAAAGSRPDLVFGGRIGDSLHFSITNGEALPPGHLDPAPWGFRYDIAADTAAVLPQVIAPPPAIVFPGGLGAYPFFAFFEPGAPLEPSLFNAVITVAGVLRTHCRYEAALKWYELYFEPLADDNRWSRCGDPPPPPDDTPRDPANPPGTVGIRTPGIRANFPAVAGGDGRVGQRAPDPGNPCCQTEIVSDALAHQRAVLLLHLETLLQFGDAAMCCSNSPEGFQKARLIFDTMRGILGRRPPTVYSQDEGISQTVAAFVPRFAPLNPRLMQLYDRVEDRLQLIHHCLNKRRLRGGTLHVDMSYWGDSAVREGWRTADGLCESDDDCCCPRSPYRFLFLVQKAQEITGDVRTLGGQLLSAFEKGDAEYLAALRAAHERQLLDLAEEVRRNEWREADWQVQALKKSKESALARRQYYAGLIADGIIANEQSYVNLTGVSMTTRAAGNIVEGIAEVMHLIPDPTVGAAGIASTPVAVMALPLGTKLAHSFSAGAHILMAVADITGTSGSLSLTEAGWDRREQEWRQQVQVLDIEIEQIERQILASERHRDVALLQLNNHRVQMQQAGEVQDFLRDKFTSQALYLFLQQETAAMHRQMHELAWCAARQAQRAFNLERGHTTRRFLPDHGWDNLHEGLMAGERLQLALRQMEKSYLDLNLREYELTKHVSLRLHFPMAFVRLRATGCCEIEIPEWLFDLDYPGQYMRRIKNVSVTIPCVVGPYTGVHCRLTLLSSATRTEPTLLDVHRCCHDTEGCCPDCAPGNGYHEVRSDRRIVRQYAATEAVATSMAQNDAGLFELSFRDERYLPFEYAGAVSRWRIELPPATNQFDLESVSDVVLHLNYTAREGGDVLRRAACEAAECCLPGEGIRFFDLEQDFGEAWQRLKGQTADDRRCPVFQLRLAQNMFPFLTGRRTVVVRRIDFFFETEDARPGRSRVLDVLPPAHGRHAPEDSCDCEVQHMTCIASAEFPCLFHGVLDVDLEPLDERRHVDVGLVRFPRDIGQIRRAFLTCRYTVRRAEGCQRELLNCGVSC